jgi:hypothetical protein
LGAKIVSRVETFVFFVELQRSKELERGKEEGIVGKGMILLSTKNHPG